MSLNWQAWAVLIIAVAILYGGSIHYLMIALKLTSKDIIRMLTYTRLKKYWLSGVRAKAMILGSILIFLLIIAMIGFSPEGKITSQIRIETVTTNDYVKEGETVEAHVDFQGHAVKNVTFWLSWTDEEEKYGLVNQPDTLKLTVTPPDSETLTKSDKNDPETGLGSIKISVSLPDRITSNDWEVLVECVDAGDSEGQLGIIKVEDDGNAWELQVIYEYI